MQDNGDDSWESRIRTQQYRDRRGNPVNARGDPLNCPFGNRLCEYGVRGGAGREYWDYHPLASKLGEDPRFRAGYVGDSPDGETAPTGRGAVIPIRCTSCGLRRPLSSGMTLYGVQNTWVDENIYTEYIRKMN
ncbi:hypothetical protein AAFF_G00375710 [Aldrovandia affinis]|uniref:Uncharacterized protein n=1 Tax=Aldrovandia affinis TaxID=143900 RepID=A0AAD7R4M9_9TELE|nr:hypothetical protein AAFF_G00375710 [Aldrovandia affinis]